jgi:hypothetical protein
MGNFCSIYNDCQSICQSLQQRNQVPDNPVFNLILRAQQGRCPADGTPLTYDHMFPKGACSRSLCTSCYDKYFARNFNPICVACGKDLPRNKAERINRNPREVTAHLCDGQCTALWILLHCYIVGEPQEAVQDVNMLRSLFSHANRSRFSIPIIGHNQDDDGCIELVPVEDDPGVLQLEHNRLAIPYQPMDEYRVDNLLKNARNKKKEKVFLIKLPKR